MVSNLNPHPLPLIGCLLSLTIFFWWSPIAPTETLAKLGSLLPSEPTVLLFRSFCHLLCLSNFQSSQVLHSLGPKTWCHLTWASVSLSFHHLRVRPMKSIILSCALFASPDRRLLEVRVLYPYRSWVSPLSMGFPRPEYWGGLPFPSARNLPDPGIKSASPAWQADSLPLSHLVYLSI